MYWAKVGKFFILFLFYLFIGDGDCVFFFFFRKELEANVVGESANFLAFRDVNPRAEGHALVVPKKHMVTLLDIPDELGSEMLGLLKKVASDLMDKKMGDGFNLVMNNLDAGGQVVKHAHVHVIPRREGDDLNKILNV